MKTLITGGTGMIGSELVRQLIDRGDEVRLVIRKSSALDLLGKMSRQVEVMYGDVMDAESLYEAMKGTTHVYHVAAYIGVGAAQEQDLMYRINVEGTSNVVNAALKAGVRRLVHTSSMAAFGRPESTDVTIDESIEWDNSALNSSYAVSKYRAELEIYRGIEEGLDAVVVNPALVFGTGRAGENTRQIVDRVRFGRMPAYPDGGTNVVDVRDVVQGHIRAMTLGQTGHRYFLGSENLSWRVIVTTLAEAFQVAPPRFVLPLPLGLAAASAMELAAKLVNRRPMMTRETLRTAYRVYRYSNKKAIEELGCTFRPFKETAKDLAENLKNTTS